MNRKLTLVVIFIASISTVACVEEIPCPSTSVRDFKHFTALMNCTVVLGNLNLYLPVAGAWPDYTPEEINSLSLPLREITGYMLVIEMTYLKSLGTMFPNLTIIRGGQLILNHALVFYNTDIAQVP